MILFICISDVVISVSIFITVYRLLCWINENSVISRLKKALEQSEKNRIDKSEYLRRIEGIQKKENVFYRLDLLINRSGLKRKIPFLNTEYLIMISVLMGMSGMITGIIVNNFLLLLFLTFLFGIIPLLVVRVTAIIVNKKLEEQIIHFLNMVENYSRTQDNLITIFGKVYPYLQEPLATAVRECYGEAVNTGELTIAFRRMETKIAHEKFGEILRNLELCGKYEANYQVIIRESRAVMTNYVKSKNKIKAIIDDAKIDFFALFICLVIIYQVIDGFVGNRLWTILTGGPIGIIILVYMALVSVYSVISVCVMTKM